MKLDHQFLGTEPVGKLLLKLAIPTVTAQLINMLYNIVDRVFIGHMPGDGDLALTGIGICFPLIMLISAFAVLVSGGGAPRASIAMGRGDPEEAERILGSCLTLQICISALLTAALLLWNRDFLLAFGGSENTIEYAVSYMNVYAVGTLFVQLTISMNFYITAQGFAKTSMLTVLIGAVCNIILDPILIFGLNMGVRGAAVATVVSQGISCAWVMAFLCGPKTILRVKPNNLRMRKAILFPCLALGLSPFVMQASESVIFVCFNASLLQYGGDLAVGAMTILTSVMQFALLPIQGVAQGAQPITSYNYGAQNPERVKAVVFLLIKVCLTYSLILWGLIMVFPRAFAGMFTPDPTLLDFTAKALRIYCGGLGIFGLQLACQMTFVAIGYAKSSILVAIVRKFILLLPLIYLMPCLLADKTMAVYTAEPVADLIAVTFTAILFGVQFRKTIRKLEDIPETQ
ncbi:MATE family efflux transporter [Evtepia sp.]|uniref:MATE family efflux transporter n=1 Tax=Evtepia sp. TaxID=2773933 RepID=UPI003F17D82E